MYYHRIYIGLGLPSGSAAISDRQRLDIFGSRQTWPKALLEPAATSSSRRGKASLAQQDDILRELQETVDYRFGRVQIEWMQGEFVVQAGGGSSAGAVASEVGIVRLFRSGGSVDKDDGGGAAANDSDDITVLAVLAVPGYMTAADFLSFAGALGSGIAHARAVRDGTRSHYMLLLQMRDAARAAEFQAYYSGKTFSPLEPETCHVVFVRAVECEAQGARGEADEFLLGRGGGGTELPTCPVCLERLDAAASGLVTTVCAHAFHSGCLQRWGDGSCPVCRHTQTAPFEDRGGAAGAAAAAAEPSSERSACRSCGITHDLWICLVCGAVGCGRYANGHAKEHFAATQHPYAMEVQTRSVWDYAGDGYVHRVVQTAADRKVVAVDAPPQPSPAGAGSLVGAREKLAGVSAEYELLLAAQLESQRAHYEALAGEAERGWARERQRLDAQAAKWRERAAEDARRLADEAAVGAQLAANQDALKAQVADLTACVADLRDQVRDLTFFITTQQAVAAEGELHGASVVGVAPAPPLSPRRGRGSGARRRQNR